MTFTTLIPLFLSNSAKKWSVHSCPNGWLVAGRLKRYPITFQPATTDTRSSISTERFRSSEKVGRSIMVPMMVDILSELGTDESQSHLEEVVADFVDALTGQQTIYQMIRLTEEIASRGGRPQDPATYKEKYHDRLLTHIERRIEGLKSGAIDPDDMLVPESRRLLKALTERGLNLYLASGTDHAYVVEEAHLLGIAPFFGNRIFGALDDYKKFSKAKLIQEMLAPDLAGAHLIGFGDGYVEIENVSQVGGTAVGVASNEVTRKGIDEWKRNRLVDAGADYIIPEYREQDILLAHLFCDN